MHGAWTAADSHWIGPRGQTPAIMHQLLLVQIVVCRWPDLSLERCPRPTQLQGLCCNRSFGVLFSTCLRDGLLLLVLLVPLSTFLKRGRYAAYDPTVHGLQYHERERLTEQNIEPVRLQCHTATLKMWLATHTSSQEPL